MPTALLAPALFSALLLAQPTATAPAERLAPAALEVTTTLQYLAYLPPAYAADPAHADGGGGRGWPLVLFLHGAGERGENVRDVARIGLPRLVADGRDVPFVLVAPQCPPDAWWDAAALLKLVDEIQRTHKIDPDRVYVTGLSMGGFGTWELAVRAPDRFAAFAPICGGGEPLRIARWPERARGLKVWAFHGAKDDVVPLERSAEMVDALRAAGNADAKLTVYADVGHDSWNRAYDDPKLFRWLLSQRRAPRP